MAIDELMLFRTTYLRAVPLAWEDPKFQGRLLEDATKALKAAFGYDWPWSDICKLVIKAAPPGHHFEWIDDEWIWSSGLNEGLTLYVPLDPTKAMATSDNTATDIPADARARALADYYRQSPSLFGDDWGKKPGPTTDLDRGPLLMGPPGTGKTLPAIKVIGSGSSAFKVIGSGSSAFNVIGSGSSAPIDGFIPNQIAFASFEVVLLAAMAMAWDDTSFKDRLKIDPQAALHDIRDYKLPWKMLITIDENKDARWHPGNSVDGGNTQSYWDLKKPNLLTLYLPTKPSELKLEPLALAMYNAAGATYPFTCCCIA